MPWTRRYKDTKWCEFTLLKMGVFPCSSVHGILHARILEWVARHTWVGKMPWRRAWLQYSCLENPKDRGAWWATVHGVAKSQDTIERLSHTHTYIHMCMHGKSLQSCLTLYDPMDYSFSVHEILQVRILEWAAISFSRVSSPSKDRTYVS